jgi:hypothetical protein
LIPKRPENLTRIVREVGELFAAQGRPVVVPPNVQPDVERANRDEKDFWDEVFRRLTPEERAWFRG